MIFFKCLIEFKHIKSIVTIFTKQPVIMKLSTISMLPYNVFIVERYCSEVD